MARIDELRTELNQLADDLTTLEGWSAADELTDEQRTEISDDTDAKLARWKTLKAEYDPLAARAEDIAKVEKLVGENRTTREGGEGPTFIQRTDSNPYDLTELRSMPAEERRTEIQSRVERAVEDFPRSVGAAIPGVNREDLQEQALRNAEDNPAIAEHILRTGNPAYVAAFNKYLANPTMAAVTMTPEEQRAFAETAEYNRAINEGSTSAGQALVPPFLDPTIILTNTGITNPFRQIATVKSITTQTWKGVTSAGVTGEWLAEASEVTDASPTFVQPSITPIRADVYVQASFEAVEDTNFASDLGMLFADCRDRLEGAAFATGTGSTQPKGIVTALQAVTNSRVATNTNGAFGSVDVFALDNSLGPRFRANASFLGNKSIFNLVRQMATGSGPQFAFWTDFGGGRPSQLIGYPVYESSSMFNAPLSTATASSDDILVLGDFRQYYIVDRIGMAVAYNPLVLGANRRPTGEVGWMAYWRVGGDTVNADAFRLLRA